MALSVLVVVPGWWKLIILRVHVSMCILDILGHLSCTILELVLDEISYKLSLLRTGVLFSNDNDMVLGVRCQLVLLLMEVAGSKGVSDEVTFEADVWSRPLRCNRCSFFVPNNGTSQSFPIALSFLICFHRELLEIPLGFSSADHLVLMPSPPVSISSPIREPPSLNNHETLIMASPHRVERLDHLDLSTVA
ncbi:hypothetical protein Gotur_000813 [Gossypium turneri]